MSEYVYGRKFDVIKDHKPEALLRLLPVVKASNKALLSGCNLSLRNCEALSSVLSSQFSDLRQLDLSNNNLHDSGVKLLCVGLKDSYCTLETLSLSGCIIAEDGCACLASALSFNPSYLRELDLSYNHPGESGMKLLKARQKDSHCKLDILRRSFGLKPSMHGQELPCLDVSHFYSLLWPAYYPSSVSDHG
ncbi:ribonuclease inhibitor-like [Oreochromis aureus]|uniref:ribonuclease inhibitor-like n=1 Tax=Oreochromis aureus TaxID=47969 RepID=UPI001954D87B|nr:ribonuclease inhibitor-like [Oreochromis aureus]